MTILDGPIVKCFTSYADIVLFQGQKCREYSLLFRLSWEEPCYHVSFLDLKAVYNTAVAVRSGQVNTVGLLVEILVYHFV